MRQLMKSIEIPRLVSSNFVLEDEENLKLDEKIKVFAILSRDL